jgi:hypothetical protein
VPFGFLGMLLVFLLLTFFSWSNSQSFDADFIKFDYCISGSSGCPGTACGASGICIADAYLRTEICSASGLGINQPANDPNVISLYTCPSERRVNYSSLSDCEARTNEVGRTYFGDLGYAFFCWGGLVNYNTNSFGQFNMSLGYYIIISYSCPGNVVTGITFVEDPAPHVCVSNQQSCPSTLEKSFMKSTVCYPNGPTGTESPTLDQLPTTSPTLATPTSTPTSSLMIVPSLLMLIGSLLLIAIQ